MNRRDAREQAFTIIFEHTFSGEPIEIIINHAVEGRNLEIDAFAKKLASASIDNILKANAHIEKLSKKWKLNRIPKTTVAILVMAMTEIDSFDDIPENVTINEALEIAKKYATEEDASYINGILGTYVENRKKQNEQ